MGTHPSGLRLNGVLFTLLSMDILWSAPYPRMAHLPGNFNSRTLTRPNEIAFTHKTHVIPGHTAHSVDHAQNS